MSQRGIWAPKTAPLDLPFSLGGEQSKPRQTCGRIRSSEHILRAQHISDSFCIHKEAANRWNCALQFSCISSHLVNIAEHRAWIMSTWAGMIPLICRRLPQGVGDMTGPHIPGTGGLILLKWEPRGLDGEIQAEGDKGSEHSAARSLKTPPPPHKTRLIPSYEIEVGRPGLWRGQNKICIEYLTITLTRNSCFIICQSYLVLPRPNNYRRLSGYSWGSWGGIRKFTAIKMLMFKVFLKGLMKPLSVWRLDGQCHLVLELSTERTTQERQQYTYRMKLQKELLGQHLPGGKKDTMDGWIDR